MIGPPFLVKKNIYIKFHSSHFTLAILPGWLTGLSRIMYNEVLITACESPTVCFSQPQDSGCVSWSHVQAALCLDAARIAAWPAWRVLYQTGPLFWECPHPARGRWWWPRNWGTYRKTAPRIARPGKTASHSFASFGPSGTESFGPSGIALQRKLCWTRHILRPGRWTEHCSRLQPGLKDTDILFGTAG